MSISTNSLTIINFETDINWEEAALGSAHWILCQIEWKRDLFPFEFIYSDWTIRSGLASPFQKCITLDIYCEYYGLKGIFNICK